MRRADRQPPAAIVDRLFNGWCSPRSRGHWAWYDPVRKSTAPITPKDAALFTTAGTLDDLALMFGVSRAYVKRVKGRVPGCISLPAPTSKQMGDLDEAPVEDGLEGVPWAGMGGRPIDARGLLQFGITPTGTGRPPCVYGLCAGARGFAQHDKHPDADGLLVWWKSGAASHEQVVFRYLARRAHLAWSCGPEAACQAIEDAMRLVATRKAPAAGEVGMGEQAYLALRGDAVKWLNAGIARAVSAYRKAGLEQPRDAVSN